MPTPEETPAAVEKAKADLAAAESAHAEAQKDAPPRDSQVILGDLFDELSMRFGHHPRIAALAAEYKKATAPKTE